MGEDKNNPSEMINKWPEWKRDLVRGEELKPCPFCGSDEMIIEYHHELWGVNCICGCSIVDDVKKYVIEKWNTRPETAWGMFARLKNEYGLKFCSLFKKISNSIEDKTIESEQVAIMLMKQIEEELKK